MLEFIDACGAWLLRLEVLLVFIGLALLPFSLIKLIRAIRDRQREIEGCGKSIQTVKFLLRIYEKSRLRSDIADAFVDHGITFMKGPFRNAVNFTPEELELLPTNEELSEAVRRSLQ